MPSYLVSARESFVPVELYRAPVDALGDTMRIKQQQYDQAFNQIAQSKSSMEGLEVLGDDVKTLKQKYLSDAANKLKNLASVDLSIPQNVSEAAKVFEPFYSDPVLMANAGRTAFNSQQIAQLDAMQNSKDEAIRDGYHPALKEYLLNDRKRIADAGLDPTAYNNFQYRKAVPFINQQKFLQEQAKEEGLKVVHTDGSGPQLIEVENGKQSLKNYAAWAASKLNDTRFNEQYMILGTVQQERNYANMRSNPMFANYSDDDLKVIHADKVVAELGSSYKKREESITARNLAIEAELGSLVVPTGAAANQMEANALAKFQALKAEYDANRDQLTDVVNDRTAFDDSRKEETKNMLLTNPSAYYASLARNADIMNFASGRASMEQIKISKNDAYWLNIEAQQDWKSLEQKDTELRMRADGTWDKDSKSSSSSSSTGGASPEVATSAVTMGSTSVGVLPVEKAIDIYKNFRGQQEEIHTNAIWDPSNGLMSVVSNLGIPGEDVVAAATGWMKKSKDLSYKMTPDEKAASTKVEAALETATGIAITGPGTFRNALYAYTNKHLEGVGKEREYNPNDYKLTLAMTNAHKTAQTMKAFDDEEKRIIDANIVTDQKYNTLVVQDGDNKRMVGLEDIKKMLPGIEVLDNGKVRKISSESLAEAYMKGTLRYDNFNRIQIDNNFFPVIKLDKYSGLPATPGGGGFLNRESRQQEAAQRDLWREVKFFFDGNSGYDNLFSRHGNAASFAELRKEALQSVVPNAEYFKGMQGMMTPRIGLPFDERATVKQETGVKIIQELTVPESVADYYAYNVANNKIERPGAEAMASIQNVMKGGEESIQKYFGTPVYDPYASKNGRVTFTLKPSITDKEITEAGLEAWKGKDIVFELNNISTVGPTLKNIRVGQQFYVWKDILDGKPITSPEIMRSGMKFGFKIIPTRSDNTATEAYTEFTFPVYNQQNGAYDMKTVSTLNYPIKGDGAVDPDTRLNMTYAELFKQIALVTSRPPSSTGVNGLELLKR